MRKKSSFSLSTSTDHFDVAAADHDAVHLLERQLRRLRNVVLDEGKALVLLGDRVPGHVDRLYGAKRQKCLPYCVLLQLKTYAAHVHPEKSNHL